MEYKHSANECHEYLRLALRRMGEHEIPVNPANYAVWYEYVSERNTELSAAVEAVISEGAGFDEETNLRLFETYIIDQQLRRSQEAVRELRRVLLEMSQAITTADGELSARENSLGEYVNRLNKANDAGELSEIAGGISSEAKKMIVSGQALHTRLVSSQEEVEQLREQLEEARQKATTDPLTGLANRAAFEMALQSAAEEARRTGEPLSLVFADIDHFKQFNDTHGHLVGDMVLKMTAAMLKGFITENDAAARYGGEEFVIILIGSDVEAGVKTAEKIRQYFAGKVWKKRETGESIGAVTLSFGVTQYRRGESLDGFVSRADQALYTSKKRGRNRVTSA